MTCRYCDKSRFVGRAAMRHVRGKTHMENVLRQMPGDNEEPRPKLDQSTKKDDADERPAKRRRKAVQ